MKTKTLLLPLFLASGIFAVAGCGPDQHPTDPVTSSDRVAAPPTDDAPATPPVLVQPQNPPSDLVVSAMAQLKEATYETRSTISSAFDPIDRQIGDRLSLWKSNGSQFTEPAERQLQDARANASQKFKELGEATEETWNSAKDNATSALQHLQGAINDLRESDKLRRT